MFKKKKKQVSRSGRQLLGACFRGWLSAPPRVTLVGDHATSFTVGREGMLISLHVRAHCPDTVLVFPFWQSGTGLDEELNF